MSHCVMNHVVSGLRLGLRLLHGAISVIPDTTPCSSKRYPSCFLYNNERLVRIDLMALRKHHTKSFENLLSRFDPVGVLSRDLADGIHVIQAGSSPIQAPTASFRLSCSPC